MLSTAAASYFGGPCKSSRCVPPFCMCSVDEASCVTAPRDDRFRRWCLFRMVVPAALFVRKSRVRLTYLSRDIGFD